MPENFKPKADIYIGVGKEGLVPGILDLWKLMKIY